MTRDRLPEIGRSLATVCVLAGMLGCAVPLLAHPPTSAEVRLSAASRPRSTVGLASWYGRPHQGLETASGERFDMYELTAAHRTLPLGMRVRVTNLTNGRSVVVRLTDRGPYVRGRLIDLSYAAGRRLGMVGPGLAPVRVEPLAFDAPPEPGRVRLTSAAYKPYIAPAEGAAASHAGRLKASER